MGECEERAEAAASSPLLAATSVPSRNPRWVCGSAEKRPLVCVSALILKDIHVLCSTICIPDKMVCIFVWCVSVP